MRLCQLCLVISPNALLVVIVIFKESVYMTFMHVRFVSLELDVLLKFIQVAILKAKERMQKIKNSVVPIGQY